MSAREGVEAELESLRVVDVAPGLAAIARALATQLDEAEVPTSAANVARELRQTMAALRALAPLRAHDDKLDELTKAREKRRSASSASKQSASKRRRRSGTAG